MHTRLVSKALLFRADGKFLAVRRSQTDTRRPLQWDLPGGIVEAGEVIEQGTLREIDEEVGLKLDMADLKFAYAATAAQEGLSVIWTYFVATVITENITLSSEHDQSEWMSLAESQTKFVYLPQLEALKYIADNQLTPAS